MAGVIQRVAMVSMHTSPVAKAGTRDAGGMNVAILGVAAELAIRGVEVDLLTRAEGRPGTKQLLPGVRLHELAAGRPGPLALKDLPAVTDEFGEAVAVLARGGGTPFDLFHAHYWLSGLAVLPVALELDVPLVQSFHTVAAMRNASLAPGAPVEPERRTRTEGYLAQQATAVIAASSAEAGVLIDEVGAPPDRIWIVPPGVDLALFSPRPDTVHERVRMTLDIDDDRPIVVVVGRVQPVKGQDLAIRAVAGVRLRGPSPVLVVVGEETPGDTGFTDRLRALAHELGIADSVRFAGALYRDALADLLSAASVTLIPSFSETFGLVALESAASGTPVIAYRASGLVESVADGVSGALLGTRDPAVWAAELSAMLEDPLRRARLASSARVHAERFTWGATAASLLGVYATTQRAGG